MISRRARRCFLSFLSTLAVATLAACQTPAGVAEPPKGFAPLPSDGEGVLLRALSPQGVRFRVRLVRNDPRADLRFWQEALRRKLENDGYTIVRAAPAVVAGTDGYLIESVAPVGDQDYGFTVALAVKQDWIVLGEAGGPRADVEAQRAATLAAVAQVRIR